MKKIAVFGGSFNPIHKGHIHLISAVDEAFGFDKILIIPSGEPPHKSADGMVSGEDRVNMCRLAARVLGDRCEVSCIELELPKPSYTVNTLEVLKERYPDDRIFFVIGSDMLMMFDRWYRYDAILKDAGIIAAARNEGEYEQLTAKADRLKELVPDAQIEVLNLGVMPMSSTEVREKLYAGESAPEYLDKNVYDYIVANHLYTSFRRENR